MTESSAKDVLALKPSRLEKLIDNKQTCTRNLIDIISDRKSGIAMSSE